MTSPVYGLRVALVSIDIFTVPGAIVFEYVQRLVINALFYGKFTSNESRSIALHKSDGTQACHYGTGWLRVYALKHIYFNITIK